MRIVDVFSDDMKNNLHIVRNCKHYDCDALQSIFTDYGVCNTTYRTIDYDDKTLLFVVDGMVIARMYLDDDYDQYVVVHADDEHINNYCNNVICKNGGNTYFEFNTSFGGYDTVIIDGEERDVRDAYILFERRNFNDKHVYIDIKTGGVWVEYLNASGDRVRKNMCVAPANRQQDKSYVDGYKSIVFQRSIVRNNGDPVCYVAVNPAHMQLCGIYGIDYATMLDLVALGYFADHVLATDYNGAGVVQLVSPGINHRLGSFKIGKNVRGYVQNEILNVE